MAEILGIGCTHYPPALIPDEHKPWPLPFQLDKDPRIPAALRDPRNWPAPMQVEWGDDEGLAAHRSHRQRLFAAFDVIRARIDAFRPDLIVIWGDDQYENFREEIIPPFCVLAYDELRCAPFHALGTRPNIWGESNDKTFQYAGHREAGKYLTRALLDAGIDMPYAYRPRTPDGLGHAFANTILFLDRERVGFPYPVLPISVNAYGSKVISYHGGILQRSQDVDPPSPSPRRCFDMGRAVARALQRSPWRTVLIASASWSHAFLCDKNHWIHPDREADRLLFEQLQSGDLRGWGELTTPWIEECGEHEFLSWVSLGGAVTELGLKPTVVEWLDTWVFNAAKCFAIFR